MDVTGFPSWLSGQESACQCKRCRRQGFDPWVRKFLGEGNGNPLILSWTIPWTEEPGRLYSPWDCKKLDMTEHPCPQLVFLPMLKTQVIPFWNINIWMKIRLVWGPLFMVYREAWVQSLSWKDSLEEGAATHSSIPAWRIPMDSSAWQAAVHGVAKSWTRLSD